MWNINVIEVKKSLHDYLHFDLCIFSFALLKLIYPLLYLQLSQNYQLLVRVMDRKGQDKLICRSLALLSKKSGGSISKIPVQDLKISALG
jgi:hypothetical protein